MKCFKSRISASPLPVRRESGEDRINPNEASIRMKTAQTDFLAKSIFLNKRELFKFLKTVKGK